MSHGIAPLLWKIEIVLVVDLFHWHTIFVAGGLYHVTLLGLRVALLDWVILSKGLEVGHVGDA